MLDMKVNGTFKLMFAMARVCRFGQTEVSTKGTGAVTKPMVVDD